MSFSLHSLPREVDFYTTEKLNDIKKSIDDYRKSRRKNAPELKQTIKYFSVLAKDINDWQLSNHTKIKIEPSYLRNLYFFEKDPNFKKLSPQQQNTVGIAKDSRRIHIINNFFEARNKRIESDAQTDKSNYSWNITDWKPRLKAHNPQGEDHYEILLEQGALRQVTCKVIANYHYYRLGFKFLHPYSDLVGESLIKTRGSDVLIHTGHVSQSDFTKKDLFVTLYVGLEKMKLDDKKVEDKFTGIFPTEGSYNCRLVIDSAMTLQFWINNKLVAQFTVNKNLLSRVYLFVWADHDEFYVEVKDIKVEIQKP